MLCAVERNLDCVVMEAHARPTQRGPVHNEIIPPTDELAINTACAIAKHQKRLLVDFRRLADWLPLVCHHSTIPKTLRTRGALWSSYMNQH